MEKINTPVEWTLRLQMINCRVTTIVGEDTSFPSKKTSDLHSPLSFSLSRDEKDKIAMSILHRWSNVCHGTCITVSNTVPLLFSDEK